MKTKHFAQFDADGFPLAFYSDDVHGPRELPIYGDEEVDPPVIGLEPNPASNIPLDAVEITAEQWQDFLDFPRRRRWSDGAVVVFEPPGPTPEALAAAARKAEFPNLFPDQFWFGLRAAGYEDDVRAWVGSLNDPDSPDYDPVAWAWASSKLEFATFFERDHPLVESFREAAGITETELDDLWRFAAQ